MFEKIEVMVSFPREDLISKNEMSYTALVLL